MLCCTKLWFLELLHCDNHDRQCNNTFCNQVNTSISINFKGFKLYGCNEQVTCANGKQAPVGRFSLIGLGMYDLLLFFSPSASPLDRGLECAGLGVDLITGIVVEATGKSPAFGPPYSETDRWTAGARDDEAIRGIRELRPFDEGPC